MTDSPLILAVPSKGRLQENAAAFFARAGLVFSQSRGALDYRGTLKGVPDVEVAFVSASEIVNQLATGAAHLGITGEDLVREQISDAEEAVEMLTPLGFGHANVIVAVPQAWIDVRTMADLDEVAADLRARRGRKMRVATKYVNLTRRFFAQKGVADYRIVESLGATEGAPGAGLSRAGGRHHHHRRDARRQRSENPRRRPHPALRGQSCRVDPRALVGAGPAGRSAVLTRIAAEEEARTSREIRADFDPARAPALAGLLARASMRRFPMASRRRGSSCFIAATPWCSTS